MWIDGSMSMSQQTPEARFNAPSLNLTEAELVEVTGYKLHSKQLIALRDMGFNPLVRPRDGRPLLTRAEYEGRSSEPKLNFDAIG
jgi:hypothetical protein